MRGLKIALVSILGGILVCLGTMVSLQNFTPDMSVDKAYYYVSKALIAGLVIGFLVAVRIFKKK
jgi:hypothetical protein